MKSITDIFVTWLFLIFFFLPGTSLAQDAQEKSPLHVGKTGNFHGEEILLGNGDSVLVFGQENGTYFLKKNIVNVEIVVDEIIDVPGEKTGKIVSLKNTDENFKAEFILYGDILSSGPIATANIAQDCLKEENKDALCNVRFGDISLPVKITDYQVADLDIPEKNFVADILLKHDNKETSIKHVNKIIWAGDLDRDGLLDLIVDDTAKYNTQSVKIYLSAQSQGNQLMGLAGQFFITGC